MPDNDGHKSPSDIAKNDDLDKKDIAEILHCLATIAPQLQQVATNKAEQETARHRSSLRFWSLPFLISIVLLGGGVLILAGMAIQRDKTDVALTIIGYLMTFLGGVGTGQSMKNKSG